jgi:hypothetical protein
MELHGGVARFIFHPSRHAESGKRHRLHDAREDSYWGSRGNATNEPLPKGEDKDQMNEHNVS